jgi:hypothetical protein
MARGGYREKAPPLQKQIFPPAERGKDQCYAVLIHTAFTLRYSSTCCLPDSRP